MTARMSAGLTGSLSVHSKAYAYIKIAMILDDDATACAMSQKAANV